MTCQEPGCTRDADVAFYGWLLCERCLLEDEGFQDGAS